MRDARLGCLRLHSGVVRVEEDVQLCLVEVLLAGCRGGAEDLVGVVEDQAEVASRPTQVSEQMVGWPASMRGKQKVHFSALPVRWLK